jgi:AsmA family/AsmA-like C-terminal region
MSRRKRWLWIFLIAVVALGAADEGLARLAGAGWLRGTLTRRLADAFGRPVEVGRYSFTLWPTPRLEAQYVTVGEDPRFGQEYFLRAQAVEAGLRWQSFLRGRFEFDTFTFRGPSLNLVRNAQGRWNLEDWLPAPAAPQKGAARSLRRLARIEISDGRINFKQGVEKSPFALVDMNGSIEQEAPGRWRIDLEATPMRAAVIVQDVGQLAMRGVVGGTSARLRPAALELTWQDASLPDVLRLLRGWDYGVRGRMQAELAATSQGADWAFSATARLRNLHRWDLPLMPGDPAVNLRVRGDWWPRWPGGSSGRLVVKEGVVEAPRSSIRVAGILSWPRRGGPASDAARLQVVSAGVGLSDLLSWYRAFHPGVAAGMAAEGLLGLDAQVTAWPLRIERGVAASDGGRIEGAAAGPFEFSHTVIRFDPRGATLLPASIALPKHAGHLRLAGGLAFDHGGSFHLQLTGSTAHLEDLPEAAALMGVAPPAVWRAVEGPAQLALAWQGQLRPRAIRSHGTIDIEKGLWRGPRGRGVVRLDQVRIEWSPAGKRILVRRADALGAAWSGWLSRRASDRAEPWQFDLKAERVETAALAALFAARQPQSFLARILPGKEMPPEVYAWMGGLDARGRVAIDSLGLGPLRLRRLRGRLAVDSGRLRLTDARADFCRGAVRGSWEMKLSVPPVYRAAAQFDRVSLAQLAGAAPTLAGRFAGVLAGELKLTAAGTSLDELARSAEGRGRFSLREAEDRRVDWFASLAAGSARPGATMFTTAFASLRVGNGRIGLDDVRLEGPAGQLEVTGDVSFSRGLAAQVRTLPLPGRFSPPNRRATALVSQTFELAGTLAALRIRRVGLAPAAR